MTDDEIRWIVRMLGIAAGAPVTPTREKVIDVLIEQLERGGLNPDQVAHRVAIAATGVLNVGQ